MKKQRGFTLLELMVVIGVIGVMATVIVTSVSTARAKARDTRRISDMKQLLNAVSIFYNENGCLPITSGSTCPGATSYSQSDSGGWDYSSQGGGFMDFLVTAGTFKTYPRDPINNMTGDASPSSTYAYRYYCYAGLGPVLGYWKEVGSWTEIRLLDIDPNYTCK